MGENRTFNKKKERIAGLGDLFNSEGHIVRLYVISLL